MYNFIYNRLHLSVGASDLTVARAALRKLTKKARRDRAMRQERKVYLREILKVHRDARDLYVRVMSGTL